METAHLLHRPLDQICGMFDSLHALLTGCGGHDDEKTSALIVAANLVGNLFTAAIEQPNHLFKLAYARLPAHVAAPSNPAWGFRITFTGMREINASIGDLPRNDCMKQGQCSAGKMRGAMPPPR